MHGLGLVHRDVKPSNVLLTLDGPLLIDFGIARAIGGTSRTKSGESTASLTSTGVSIGSPGYMAPEQILGKGVTGAADVFSLGAVLAYAATGAPPFPGDSSAALLYRVVHEPPELDGLTGDLREVTEACLDKDPSARPSPAGITGRLAPEGGAARLVSGGWLPGALVEQVSRAAVNLLNLETTGGGPAGGVASGPVGFSSPSVGEGTHRGGRPGRGPAGAVGTGPASSRPSAGGSAPASAPSPTGPGPSGRPAVAVGSGPPPDRRPPVRARPGRPAVGSGRRPSCRRRAVSRPARPYRHPGTPPGPPRRIRRPNRGTGAAPRRAGCPSPSPRPRRPAPEDGAGGSAARWPSRWRARWPR
ncbi:hypothetical protein STREPTOSP366_38510 [Streptomyces variabilis]